MLAASARALWPFIVRFSAPSPAWIARTGGRRSAPPEVNLPLVILLVSIYTAIAAAAHFVAALGSVVQYCKVQFCKTRVESSSPRVPAMARMAGVGTLRGIWTCGEGF